MRKTLSHDRRSRSRFRFHLPIIEYSYWSLMLLRNPSIDPFHIKKIDSIFLWYKKRLRKIIWLAMLVVSNGLRSYIFIRITWRKIDNHANKWWFLYICCRLLSLLRFPVWRSFSWVQNYINYWQFSMIYCNCWSTFHLPYMAIKHSQNWLQMIAYGLIGLKIQKCWLKKILDHYFKFRADAFKF